MSSIKSGIIVVCMLITLVIGAGSETQVLAGAAVEVSNPSFNFGKLIQRSQASHVFWVKSVGDDTLRITKIDPGCGCTKVPLVDSVIAPGDSVALEILFSTRSFRGYVSKHSTFLTNAGAEKTYLGFNAEMIAGETINQPEKHMPLYMKPFRMDVSQFTTKPRRRSRLRLENRADYDCPLTLIDYPAEFFTVEMPEIIKAGDTASVVITILESRVGDEFERSFTFEVELPDELPVRYTIPVKRMVRIKDGK